MGRQGRERVARVGGLAGPAPDRAGAPHHRGARREPCPAASWAGQRALPRAQRPGARCRRAQALAGRCPGLKARAIALCDRRSCPGSCCARTAPQLSPALHVPDVGCREPARQRFTGYRRCYCNRSMLAAGACSSNRSNRRAESVAEPQEQGRRCIRALLNSVRSRVSLKPTESTSQAALDVGRHALPTAPEPQDVQCSACSLHRGDADIARDGPAPSRSTGMGRPAPTLATF